MEEADGIVCHNKQEYIFGEWYDLDSRRYRKAREEGDHGMKERRDGTNVPVYRWGMHLRTLGPHAN